MFNLRTAFVLPLVLACTCLMAQTHDHPEHDDHDHGHAGHDDHDHDDAAHAVQVTLWQAGYEFFVEYEPPTAGQTVDFVVHLTQLQGWQPRTQGAVQFKQIPARGPAKLTTADAPLRDGIYVVPLKFPIAGDWRVAVSFSDASDALVQAEIPVSVVDDPHAVPHVEEASDTITFLKEQQWRMDFESLPVAQRAMHRTLAGNGEIVAKTTQHVRIAAPLSGRLQWPKDTALTLGAKVVAGQVLAYIAPTLAQADDPAGLAAALEQAQLEHTFAQAEHARLQRLFAKEIVAGNRVRAAAMAVAQTASTLKAAQQRIAQTQAGTSQDQHRLAIRATLDGTITAIGAAPGTQVASGDALFEIVDLSAVWLKVHVPAAQLLGLAQPEDAVFSLEGSAPSFQVSALGGSLVAVGESVDPQTRMVAVIYELPNPQAAFKLGMFAQASLLVGVGTSSLAVPRSALLEEKGQAQVFVHLGGESFKPQLVKLGISEGDWVQITAGLQASDRVVSKGAYQVKLAGKTDAVADHGHAH